MRRGPRVSGAPCRLICPDKRLDRCGQGFALRLEDTCPERRDRILRHDGYDTLQKNWTVIKFIIYQMDGASGLWHAGFQHGSMHPGSVEPFAAELGNQ